MQEVTLLVNVVEAGGLSITVPISVPLCCLGLVFGELEKLEDLELQGYNVIKE